MSWEWLLGLGFLPLLALLACPIMMIWMMRGMGKDRGGRSDGGELDAKTEAEVSELRARVAELEAERAAGADETTDREEAWR